MKKLNYSLDAEQSLIGCILFNDKYHDDIFVEVEPKDFYVSVCQDVFKVCLSLWKAKKVIDYTTIMAAMENRGLDKIHKSLMASLTNMEQSIPSNANYRQYIDILKTKTAQRDLEKIASELTKAENPYSARDKALTDLSAINESKSSVLEHIGVAADEAAIYMADLKAGNKEIEGIHTPYKKLNYILGGLQKGEVTVIAARPGIGKSAMINEILLHAAKANNKVALFNLEMAKKQIALRMYANLLNKSIYDLTNGSYNVAEVAKANEKLKEFEIYIDINSYTIEKIARACRVQKKRRGLDLLCVDYLQLVTSTEKSESRRVEVDNISRQIKLLAVDLDIPMVELCQLNRGTELSDREPVLSDLRESGSIEQDASQVIFLHREKDKEKKLGYRENIDRFLKVIIAKNRNGAVGSVYMKFEADKMRFIEVDKDGNLIRDKFKQIGLKPVSDTDMPF
jgi:replicative DNA helicase